MRFKSRQSAVHILATLMLPAQAQPLPQALDSFPKEVLPAEVWSSCSDIGRKGLLTLRAPLSLMTDELQTTTLEPAAAEVSTGSLQINCYQRTNQDSPAFVDLQRALAQTWSQLAAPPYKATLKPMSMQGSSGSSISTSAGTLDAATGCITRLFEAKQNGLGLIFAGAYIHCPTPSAAALWEKAQKERGDRVESTLIDTTKSATPLRFIHRN